MKARIATLTLCLASALIALPGCGDKAGSDVSDLQQAFPKEKATTPEQKEIHNLVETAAAAAQKGEFEKAAASLTVLRAEERLTPAQRAAVQDQMSNLQADLAARAEAGDANAKRALDAIRSMKNR